MKTIDAKSPTAAKKAAETIQNGGVVVFPTDTAYGIGVNATNNRAVRHLYMLKRRDTTKPIHVIVKDLEMAREYAETDAQAERVIQALLPGALTLVLQGKGRVSFSLNETGSTIGIRIPDNKLALDITRLAGVPITATSANRSGDLTPYSIEEVQESFGGDFENIDLVIDAGPLPRTLPSTLVDMTGKKPKILRKGPVSREQIRAVLG